MHNPKETLFMVKMPLLTVFFLQLMLYLFFSLVKSAKVQSNWNFCCLFNTLLVLILITTIILNVSSTRKKGSLYKASLSLEWVSQCDIFHNTNLFEARDACKGFLKTSWIIDRHLMYSTSVESISWATCALFSPTDVPVLASDWSAFGKGTLN